MCVYRYIYIYIYIARLQIASTVNLAKELLGGTAS